MLLVFVVVLLLWTVTAQLQPCVLSYGEWLDRLAPNTTTLIPNEMCGERWDRLLMVDTSRMIMEENRLWVLGFHKYACAYLNRNLLLSALPNTTNTTQGIMEKFNESGVNEAILLLGDTLEKTCHNVSLWRLLPSLLKAMILVDEFNHGIVPGLTQSLSCASSTTYPPAGNNTFYYFESPDIITIKDPATNMTYTKSLLKNTLNTQYFFYFFTAFLSFVAGMLAIKLFMVQDASRKYHADKKVNHHHQDGGEEVSETELKEMNIVSIGLSEDEDDAGKKLVAKDSDLDNVEI